ncbi:fumarylacetoacetate hydrolase family protein [Akkermansiaceae bacterium]|nr:fumarylacetoacetate hydrolase family protein [Akkermansiaceae bacterium]MDB4500778.1 fumarylacetoacetate hydrolase family protein [Akkermansiaceae bacterium]
MSKLVIPRPSKIVCVGQNYAAHARETGGEPPSEPVLFQKASSSWAAPFAPLVYPVGAAELDYEIELGLVLGKRAQNVSREDAFDYIEGYLVLCDYSERAWQKEHEGQWNKGKSHDGFCPAGPRLVPASEVPDPQNLKLWTKVNGETRQDSNTNDMIFPIDELISYISRFMTLLPGDVISTGTPEGVGLGMNPPQFLKVGDIVELGIEGIGEIRQEIIAGK